MTYGKTVIIGAGALGLGFLAERMAGDYEICMVDTSEKAEVLRRIWENQGFTVNICGSDGIYPVQVNGSFETIVNDTEDGRRKLNRAMQEASLIFTATNRKLLDRIAADIAPSMNAHTCKRWLLFCENGLNIAEAYAEQFNPQTVLVDTIMSRMCRFGDREEKDYQPIWPGFDGSLVVEEYNYLPLDKDLCTKGPFSPAFSMVSQAEFKCWEDIKLYLHNGMHAFVACSAFLEGVRLFRDTPPQIREKAKTVILDEVVPAITRTHPAAKKEEIERYGLGLLDRFFNPYFNDSIERGIRGIAEKLAPGERLIGGCEYIKRAGIEPRGYSGTIEAAKKILSGEYSGTKLPPRLMLVDRLG